MSRINRVKNMFEELEDLSTKYSDYRGVSSTEIVYHDPVTQEQKEKAEKIANGTLHFYYIFSAVSIIAFISTIVFGNDIRATLLMLVWCILAIGITLKNKLQKIQVITGRAVYKDTKVYRTNSSHRRYIYRISVIPDGEEKVIYKGIQISKEEYDKVTEGTPVMVVNKGPIACIM